MNIFHTLIIKIASVVSAVLLFVGVSTTQPQVTVVDVQNNGSVTVQTATTTQPDTTPAVVVSATVPATPENTPGVPTVVVTVPTNPSVATETVPKTASVPIYIIQSQPVQTTAPQAISASIAPLPITPTPQKNMDPATITIKNPLPGKGLGREYAARATELDELNAIDIGAIIKDSNGNVVSDTVVTVTTDDASQDKELNGTGNMSTFGDPNNPKAYYPFHYLFKTIGKHVIRFSAMGVSQSVEIEVTKTDDRPDKVVPVSEVENPVNAPVSEVTSDQPLA